MVGATADTNVYISALVFGGLPDKILDMARAGDIRLTISDDILAELTHVLRDKFRWTEEAVKLATDRLGDFTERVTPQQRIDAIKDDPTDNRIVECAVASGSDYLVSGDRHLLKVRQYQGVKIVSPAEFVRIRSETSRER